MSNQDMLPFPPDEYMALVCGLLPIPELHNAFQGVGQWLVNLVDDQQMLGEHIRFLDIGCGCGRFARYLLAKPLASYIGFDRHAGMIDWCLHEITTRAPKYNFRHFNIKSAYEKLDNQVGDISASTFRFPFESHTFDSVLLSSVFTHMPIPEVYNYLQEIHRTLSRGGKVLLSVFFSEDEERVMDGYNFFLSKGDLLNAIKTSNFNYNFILENGGHHWYVLTRSIELPIEFDANIYLAIHKDVADAGVDPVQHYLTHGYREGRRLR